MAFVHASFGVCIVVCDAANWSHTNLVLVQKNVQATFSAVCFGQCLVRHARAQRARNAVPMVAVTV